MGGVDRQPSRSSSTSRRRAASAAELSGGAIATVSTSRSQSRARAGSSRSASTVPLRRPEDDPCSCSALRTWWAMRTRSSSSIEVPTKSTWRVSNSECRTPASAARVSPNCRYSSRVRTTLSGCAASPCSLSSHGLPGSASSKGSTCTRRPMSAAASSTSGS